MAEEPPTPIRLPKLARARSCPSKILFESLGGTCQVTPEEKDLLGSFNKKNDVLDAWVEEPKATCVLSPVEEVKIQKKPDAQGTETTSTQVSAPCTVSLYAWRRTAGCGVLCTAIICTPLLQLSPSKLQPN